MPVKHASITTTLQVDADTTEVACDGGGVSGHPLVYLPFGKKNRVICYYCGRRFQKRPAQDH
ncbi:MAG: zinc-finger domain-containing protein [Gammaproteobacteria bacterium]|nr:zinc-finger domain-containing protein [Gammaproteobacteria bacterium]